MDENIITKEGVKNLSGKLSQETTEKREKSFLSRVTEYFLKLMDKFTQGKYATPEEHAFFADEENLYDENGKPTEAYLKKIKEYEDHVKSHDVNEFISDVHCQDSKEFGTAYNETEMAIIENANAFIDNQKRIEKDLEAAKDIAASKEVTFDVDVWLLDYLKQNEIYETPTEVYARIRDMVLDELGQIEIEMNEIEENDMYKISQKINIREFYQKIMSEVITQK